MLQQFVCLSPKYHLTRAETAGALDMAAETDPGRPAESASDPSNVDIAQCYYFQAPACNSRGRSAAITFSLRGLTARTARLHNSSFSLFHFY